MRAISISFCRRLITGLVAFVGFGFCLSCMSVIEQRLGLVGKDLRLPHAQSPISIPLIGKNLSGVTWSNSTGTLFAVTNSPQVIYELSKKGEVLRSIPLEGFHDTEDITHIEDDQFAVIEERRGLIRRVRISDNTTSIHAKDSPSIDLGTRHEDNKGYESLFFDRSNRSFLTMLERRPFDLFSIPMGGTGNPVKLRLKRLNLAVKDVAAVTIDANGELWVLSEASSCVIRQPLKGSQSRRIRLEAGSIPFKPEGLAFDDENNLYVVGEPATFVVLHLNNR
jgi:uncharacterized protein YjiK